MQNEVLGSVKSEAKVPTWLQSVPRKWDGSRFFNGFSLCLELSRARDIGTQTCPSKHLALNFNSHRTPRSMVCPIHKEILFSRFGL